MDCQYGVPWVMKEKLDPNEPVTSINTDGQTCISGRALEEEEYWYVWRGGEEGRYVPCYRPENYMKGGPIG